jgi:hypothetical protein
VLLCNLRREMHTFTFVGKSEEKRPLGRPSCGWEKTLTWSTIVLYWVEGYGLD